MGITEVGRELGCSKAAAFRTPWGWLGFLIAFTGTVMLASLEWSTAFLFPGLAESAPEFLDGDPSGTALAGFLATVLLLTVGWLLFGLASLRAGVLPRGPVSLLLAGTVIVLVLGFADAPFIDVVWGLGLAWLGYTLWSDAYNDESGRSELVETLAGSSSET